MPNISQYLRIRFGILVSMYYGDTAQHHLPHVHVELGNDEAVIGIPRGELIEGEILGRALRKVPAWIELNEEALMHRWERAVERIPIDRVD